VCEASRYLHLVIREFGACTCASGRDDTIQHASILAGQVKLGAGGIGSTDVTRENWQHVRFPWLLSCTVPAFACTFSCGVCMRLAKSVTSEFMLKA
jgi:hypothetical protein